MGRIQAKRFLNSTQGTLIEADIHKSPLFERTYLPVQLLIQRNAIKAVCRMQISIVRLLRIEGWFVLVESASLFKVENIFRTSGFYPNDNQNTFQLCLQRFSHERAFPMFKSTALFHV